MEIDVNADASDSSYEVSPQSDTLIHMPFHIREILPAWAGFMHQSRHAFHFFFNHMRESIMGRGWFTNDTSRLELAHRVVKKAHRRTVPYRNGKNICYKTSIDFFKIII